MGAFLRELGANCPRSTNQGENLYTLPKRRLAVVGLTALATVGATVSVTAAAPAESDPPRVTVAMETAPAHPALATAKQAAAAPSWCRPGQNEYNRFQACTVSNGTFTVTHNRQVVGRLNFTVTQHIGLNAKSPKFTEQFSLKFTSGAGTVDGFATNLAASCGGSCKATSHVPHTPTRVGETINGTISYSDTTSTKNSTHTSYGLTFTRPGYLSTPAKWSSLTYRCDKGNKAGRTGNYGTGCVFTGYAPFETQQAALPGISKNIARIQKAGPHHYGAYGLHGSPLHRTADATVMKNNRRIACPDGRPRPTGKSCDEYPFASTQEGAANKKAKPGDWGWAWVPVGEQNKQRNILNDFYRHNRILNGDRFWVAVQ
ncbi:Deoxyribonuclease NucA/NucB [Streptomyces sp. 2323.1]|nr:Deoxyribonuclease NucA/NucB [Streptomyces sp. 2323.1]